MPKLHFHDLRHTWNQFAANSPIGLRDLMARRGHDSERAALVRGHPLVRQLVADLLAVQSPPSAELSALAGRISAG